MAKSNDSNKKLPKNPGEVTRSVDVRYLDVMLRADGKGSQSYSPYDFSEAKNNSFEESWTPMGSFTTRESHEKTELSTSMSFETRGYNIGGHSFTGEAHVETYVKDTNKLTVEGDNSREVGKNDLSAIAGQKISAALLGTVTNNGGGQSEAPTYVMSAGDHTQEHSGNYYLAFEKDTVESVKGTKMTMVQEGDYAIHTQQGNFDLQVSAGKLHLMTSGDDLIANSNVRVLVQVGSQSKITVEPAKIRLEVGSGSYIEITSDGIKMISPRIDLN
jgi:hypothetical protein